jgi:hypothetical protein
MYASKEPVTAKQNMYKISLDIYYFLHLTGLEKGLGYFRLPITCEICVLGGKEFGYKTTYFDIKFAWNNGYIGFYLWFEF